METGRAGRRAKGASKPGSKGDGNARRSPVNTGDPPSGLFSAECRVREIQAKLHQWASGDPHRRFDDLYNLVCDPAFVLVAWDRVRSNKGARSAGVDGKTAYAIESMGVGDFLDRLRSQLKDR